MRDEPQQHNKKQPKSCIVLELTLEPNKYERDGMMNSIAD